MSTIAENAAAVKAAQEAIDEAIAAKGGTTAGGLVNAAAAIATIPTGGGADWTYRGPDPRKILEKHDLAEYANVMLMMFDAWAAQMSPFPNGNAYRFSDTEDVVTTTKDHAWDESKDIDGRYRWVIVYSSLEFVANFNGYAIAYQISIIGLCFKDGSSISNSSYSSRANANCQYIIGDFTWRSNGVQAFYAWYSLMDFDRMKLAGTDVQQSFVSCGSIVNLPRELDLSQSSGATNIFGDNYNVKRFFERVSVNPANVFSFDISKARFLDPDTLAKFDDGGNIVGGIAFGNNVTDLTGQTSSSMTFRANVKTAMNAGGAGRWNAFVAAMSAKNWSISPAAD